MGKSFTIDGGVSPFANTLELDTGQLGNLTIHKAVDPDTGEQGVTVMQYDRVTDTTVFFALGRAYLMIAGNAANMALQEKDLFDRLPDDIEH